ncbi:Hypothetical protein MVR_LOCUS334 [uncultured virus]|nr:Hypothetical protein MVR_LOCUS334 [uncultured virus]
MIIMCDKPAQFTYSQLTNGLRGNPNVKTVMLYFVDVYSSMLTVTFTIDECDATHAVDLVLANCRITNKHPDISKMVEWLYLSWNSYHDSDIADTYPIPKLAKLPKLANTTIEPGAFARYHIKSNTPPYFRQN